MAESRSPYLKGAGLYVNLCNLYPGRKERNFVVRTGAGKDRAAGRERGARTGGVRGGGGRRPRPGLPPLVPGGRRGVRDRPPRRPRTPLAPERAGQPALRRRGEDP